MRPDSTANERGWTRYQVYALTVLSGAYMLNFADRHLLSVLIEPMKSELGTSDTEMGLLSGIAFAIFYAIFGIPVSSWADRGNRRTILSIGIAVWSVMTAVTGASRSFVQVLLARIGVGAGGAGQQECGRHGCGCGGDARTRCHIGPPLWCRSPDDYPECVSGICARSA